MRSHDRKARQTPERRSLTAAPPATTHCTRRRFKNFTSPTCGRGRALRPGRGLSSQQHRSTADSRRHRILGRHRSMIRPKRPSVPRPVPGDLIVRPDLVETQHRQQRRPGFPKAFSGRFERIRQPNPQLVHPHRVDRRVEVCGHDQRLICKFARQFSEPDERRFAKHQRIRFHIHQQNSH